jgi:prophage tail gpP-like protein
MAAPTQDEVGLAINGKAFRFWQSIEITLGLDSFSTVRFTAPFEADRREFRDTFRPFTYQTLDVTVGGAVLFTGRLVGIHPEVSAESRTVDVTAYALPAFIGDCTAPESALPLEFRNVTLRTIAESLLRPFSLSVSFPDGDGAAFEKAALETDQKIGELLADLARQRNRVIASTADGALLCWKSVAPGSPVARLKDHEQPVTGAAPDFSPQDYYSQITGFSPTNRRRQGAKHTVLNPWLTDVLRPLSFKLDDTERGDTAEETRAKAARMFANAAAFTVEVATWRDPSGALWKPNTTVTLLAPDAMVYSESELLVRTVTLKQDKQSTTATLGLVLPGVFSGTIPTALPWND